MKMKKRFSAVFAAILLLFILSLPAFAASDQPLLVDDADLLTDHEESVILATLNTVSKKQQADIVIVTVDSLDGKTATEYADDFYDEHGYGYGSEKDGALLLIGMDDQQWAISTCGFGITALTDAAWTTYRINSCRIWMTAITRKPSMFMQSNAMNCSRWLETESRLMLKTFRKSLLITGCTSYLHLSSPLLSRLSLFPR